MKKSILMAALAITVAATSCKKDDGGSSSPGIITSTQTLKVRFGTPTYYSLFKFSDSTIKTTSADSATANWDFGVIQANYIPNIISNSHASGPGAGGSIVQAATFSSVTSAPSTGYAYDTTKTQLAIKGSDWFNYDPITHLPSLITPRTFIFKAADGAHYAKVELLNVGYLHLIGSGASMAPDTLTYQFRYTYQANGTTTF